ncbi:DUF2780 domain-containing protein [Pseudomonas monteilii]|uniref:DUF2780 domain-containing protein n=1 Tax=Pseudomonas monteilii TaxID=76759 RepID=UPI00383BEF4A
MKAFTLATLMSLAASPVFAFNLSDAANAVSAMQNQNQNQNQNQQGQVQAPEAQANLLNTLGSELKITPEQAVGGAGAMLGLARNNLSSEDYGQLTKAVPGLDLLAGANALGGLSGLGGLLGKNSESQSALSNALGSNVENRSDLDTAFKALGMDTGMIGQFAPLILQYLGQQGIAGSLLQNLGSLWTTPAPLVQPSV